MVCLRRRHLASRRGFTLTELMVVVAIVGILSTIGYMVLRAHLRSSRVNEATAMLQSIRAAQERFRSENGVYLDVSTTDAGWYPRAPVEDSIRPFHDTGHTDYRLWRLLDPTVSGPVHFGYVSHAGLAGTVPPDLHTAAPPTWGTPVADWYTIEARSDFNGDGVFGTVATSSFTGEVYIENAGE